MKPNKEKGRKPRPSSKGAPPPETSTSLGVVIVAHGSLAPVLQKNAEGIVGALSQCRAIHVDQNVDVEEARASIGKAIQEVDGGGGVLLLTDMLGGTPSNISLSFLGQQPVEVVTGVNLPMLLKLPFILDKLPLREAAAFIRDYGRKNITVAGDILEPEKAST
ncbi:MAG: PTS sugar transporter subunit IIA [Nitrospinota bacterium]